MQRMVMFIEIKPRLKVNAMKSKVGKPLTDGYPRPIRAATFERYADGMVVHCKTLEQAECMKDEIGKRLEACKPKFNMEKTKLAYYKDKDRRDAYLDTEFDFLGYTFKVTIVGGRMNYYGRDNKSAIKYTLDCVKIGQMGDVHI